MLKVLVTGVGGGVGQGVIKSLRLIKDLDFFIIAADMSVQASGLYGGDFCHIIPAVSDKGYFDEIEKICLKHEVDYYFPGTDVELLFCSINAVEIKKNTGTTVVVSPLNVIETANDKYKTINFLANNKFYYPITWLACEADLNELNYPVIIKPRIGCRSIGVHLVKDKYEAKSAIDSLQDPIIQEYIDGDEYTCTIAMRGGVASDVLCLRRELRAGDTYRSFPERNELIEDYVKNIAITLKIEGSCNFQLRIDSVGTPKLFEINSRFSGTTPFCAYLGFNPPEFFIKKDLGLPYNSNISFNKVVLRHWCEVVVDKEDLDLLAENNEGKISTVTLSSML